MKRYDVFHRLYQGRHSITLIIRIITNHQVFIPYDKYRRWLTFPGLSNYSFVSNLGVHRTFRLTVRYVNCSSIKLETEFINMAIDYDESKAAIGACLVISNAR